jgi:DNA invertase Pin-like site-specific DNA recombinase
MTNYATPESLSKTLRVRGIGFRSLTEALDTRTARGRLVFHMFGALAEFERGLIRERTQAGLAAARRADRTGGRPPKLTEDDLEAALALLANPDIAPKSLTTSVSLRQCSIVTFLPREPRILPTLESLTLLTPLDSTP